MTKGEWPRGIFLYAGTEDDAREAELLAQDTLARRGLSAYVAVRRWHPDSRVWGGPEVVPASTEDASGTERRPTAARLPRGLERRQPRKPVSRSFGGSLWGYCGLSWAPDRLLGETAEEPIGHRRRLLRTIEPSAAPAWPGTTRGLGNRLTFASLAYLARQPYTWSGRGSRPRV